MPIFDHFKYIAPFYDKVFKPGDPEWLTELVELPIDGLLLDAGGGTGRISQFFKDKVRGTILVDLSFEMLQQASGKDRLQTVCSHTEGLPFPSETFSRIIMVDAFHHVCDQEKTAKELWRVLKVDGRLVIEEPDISYFGVKLIAIGEKILGMRSHFIQPSKIETLFNQEAKVRIMTKPPISWIIIEKPGVSG
jgi:ubiquinone/menaquinone biosynthesis C-methylase UbiE